VSYIEKAKTDQVRGLYIPWLEALGFALASYWAIAINGDGQYAGPRPLSKTLQQFLLMPAEERAIEVIKRYELCDTNMQSRIRLFTLTHEAIYQEFRKTC
jgi:hypothetical protein